MNLLVVGASYRTAPVAMLERLAVAPADVPDILRHLINQPYVGEAVVVSTCNRVEVYAAVSGFHGGLGDIGAVLASRAGCNPTILADHLYVHYDAAAVEHAFRVATGLDSMVVGEAQILGQLRDAYHTATEAETAGRLLHELMQQALRVGKRAHAETGIDHAGQNIVTAALDVAAGHLPGGLAGRAALVLGAGSMGALAVATLARLGAGPLAVANRGVERAARLAEAYGARAVPVTDLAAILSTVDIVVSATASAEPVLGRDTVAEALDLRRHRGTASGRSAAEAAVEQARLDRHRGTASGRSAAEAAVEQARLDRHRGTASGRSAADGPLVLLDLAVPRDVEPAVAELPGVKVIDIDGLAAEVGLEPAVADTAEVTRIVAGEVEAFVGWLRGADVAPTVAALRARADDVVTAELRRLAQRRADLSDEQRAEVAHTVHRVVQRLLHSPTVRVRQLAAEPGGDQYAALLRELFDLEVPTGAGVRDVPDLADGPEPTRGGALAGGECATEEGR